MMKKKIFIYICIISTIIILGCILYMKSINRKIDRKVKSVTFRCEMLGEDGQNMLYKTYTNCNEFKENFRITTRANVDVYYQVILINNYQQVNFDIDSYEGEFDNNIIHIPNTRDEVYEVNFSLTTEMENGLNDYLLIFMEVPKDLQSNSIHENSSKFMFYKRFSVNNGNKMKMHDDSREYEEYEVVSDVFNNFIAINPEYRNDIKELVPQKTIHITKSNCEVMEIPIAINIKKSIEGSPFFEKYLVDEKQNRKQTLAVLAISDGELLPLYDLSGREVFSQFYNVELGDTVLIKTRISTINKYNNQNITFYVLPYPDESLEDLLRTYKATNWSTVLSDTIKIIME